MEKIRKTYEKLKNSILGNKLALVGCTVALALVILLLVVFIVSCSSTNNKKPNDTSESKSISEDTSNKETTTIKEANKETTQEETTQEETTQEDTTVPTSTEVVTTQQETTSAPSTSNGISKLKVQGTKLVNETGQTVVLNGVSTHGIAWFPQYVSADSFKTLRDSFGANVVRIAMYSDPGAGYYEGLHAQVEAAVEYATSLGMYVIIDWHILSDGNPNIYKSNAISFFDKMSKKYKDYSNVLYEICNEPNGCSWPNDVKPYALDVIKTIRANDPDGIILVGTTTWSQDVDQAADDPITGYDNIMYTMHFYAATHKEWNQQKLEYAINKGLPVFVSEFSICDASGNGGNDIASGNTWMSILDRYNISFVGWNLSNKAESSAIINSSCNKLSGWMDDELTESGRWLINQLRNH